MISVGSIRPFWAGLIVLGLLLVALSFGVRVIREEGARLRRLEDTLAELRSVRRETETPLAGASGEPAPVPDEAALRAKASEASVAVRGPDVTTLPRGWVRKTLVVTVTDLPPERVGPWLSSLDAASPAWRVTGVDLRAEAGEVRGSVRVETLSRP